MSTKDVTLFITVEVYQPLSLARSFFSVTCFLLSMITGPCNFPKDGILVSNPQLFDTRNALRWTTQWPEALVVCHITTAETRGRNDWDWLGNVCQRGGDHLRIQAAAGGCTSWSTHCYGNGSASYSKTRDDVSIRNLHTTAMGDTT